jgi:hypothetical protein
MTFLQSQIELLERRVAIGEYDPSTFRCLQLAINPSTQDLAIRTATLDALKAENEALLETLANGGGEGDGNMVPRESWEREVRERREEKLQLEKRLLRLKEVRPSHAASSSPSFAAFRLNLVSRLLSARSSKPNPKSSWTRSTPSSDTASTSPTTATSA